MLKFMGFGFTRFSACAAVGTGGINTVNNVVQIKPTSITVLRLQWSDFAEDAKSPMHGTRVGPTAI